MLPSLTKDFAVSPKTGSLFVMPANLRHPPNSLFCLVSPWIPAFAGMTLLGQASVDWALASAVAGAKDAIYEGDYLSRVIIRDTVVDRLAISP
jgi:hypothetical protein